MNGILSRTPGQSAIRLLLGTHLLLHVQVAIPLLARAPADLMLRSMNIAMLLLSLLALLAAVHGGPVDDGTRWYQRRRGKSEKGARP